MRNGFHFYAYWNGESVRDLFESIVTITSAGEFFQLASVLVLLGVVIALAIGSTRAEGKQVITYFACCTLFWFVTMIPKVTVIVEDIRTEKIWTIDNVPLGIGVFGSMTNRIGYWLSQSYESSFSSVQVSKFSKFGAVFPERVLEVLQSIGPVTVEGRATMDAVISGCVVPELLTDRKKAAFLSHSTDLWGTVSSPGWVNSARSVAMPSGTIENCPVAMEQLSNVIESVELPAIKAMLGVRLAPDHIDPSAILATSLPQAESLLMGLSRTMDQSLRHAVMLTVIPQNIQSVALRSNSPLAMAVGLAKAQGNLAGEINYRTMAKIAQDSLPKIRNALEFIVIGMFPVVVLLALISGSGMGMIVRSYVMLLMTVQLWPAIASIINQLMISRDEMPFSIIAEAFGGSTMQATALIRETGATSQAIAGGLMCMVPVISYALVRAGDLAVGQLVGGLTSPSQSAASSQGASLAAGNIGQGNVSIGNYSSNNSSSNKQDNSTVATNSDMVMTKSAWGTVTRTDGGVVTGMSRTGVSLGINSNVTQSLSRNDTASHTVQTTTMWSDASRFSMMQSANSNDATERKFANALQEAINHTRTIGSESTGLQSVNRSTGISNGIEMSTQNGMKESFTINTGVTGGATVLLPSIRSNDGLDNIGIGLGNRNGDALPVDLQKRISNVTKRADVFSEAEGVGEIKLSGRGEVLDVQTLIDQATGKNSTVTRAEKAEAYSKMKRAVDLIASNNSDESVRSSARQFSQSLTKAHSTSRDKTQAMTDSITAGNVLNESVSAQMQTTSDNSVSVMRNAIDFYGSPEDALRAMYTSEGRANLANNIHSKEINQVSPQDDFGPGTMVNVSDRNGDVYDNAIKNVDMSEKRNKDYFERKTGENSFDNPLDNNTKDLNTFKNQHLTLATEINNSLSRGSSDLDLERGILLISKEAYSEESQDKNFALRNAFLGAWGYRSGEEIQADMRQRSENNEDLRNALTEIGRNYGNKISAKNWKAMVNLARKPRGLH